MRDAFSTDRRVVVLGFARMAEAFGNAFLLVVLPLYIKSSVVRGSTFGLSESFLTGILLSLTGLIASGGQPLLGYVSDVVQKRRVFIVAGLGVLAFTDLIYIVAATYVALFAIRFVQGLGNMLTVPTTIALINEYSEPGTRGENMGIYTTLRMVGTGLGPVAAGLIIDRGPYKNPVLPGREIALEGTGIAVTVMEQFSGFDAAFIVAAIGTAMSAVLVTVFVFDPEDIGLDPDRTKRPTFGLRGV
ncbi:MAG: MFS transporter [Natrialbaceae archaeon]|nr:MFS transporter [Natrialbaceae archaeon]